MKNRPACSTQTRRQFLATKAVWAATLTLGRWAAVAAEVALPERGVCAHRGASATHPENTLPAFEEALRVGAHMIEFDVKLTRDGAQVLMHDDTIDRTTNGHGKVSALTLKELKALDAGVRMDQRFAGTRIPTFEEALAMMPPQVWLNCHLKGGTAAGAAAAQTVARLGKTRQAFLAAGKDAANAARKAVPDILICNMERQESTEQYVRDTIAMKAAFIQLLGKGTISEDHVRQLKAAKVHVNYYRDESPEGLRRLWKAGVDFPLANDPAKALVVAKELGISPVSR